MPRVSAFRGTWQPNRRPYITMAPDVYISLQGETSVIACGECRRTVNFNDYLTGVNTEASVDSPPGSATVNLSIPDNDVNQFYVDGQFIIIPMMEIEIFSKGYYLVGGFPQYYRIFWGIVSSVTKDWSGGTTTITISCRDILRWWELTNITINPAFLESFGSSAGGYQLWQNQFAGLNPYTVIIQLARESMGDFSLNTSSFTSFLPEKGPESGVFGSFAKDIMTYWQYKFSNIWTQLIMYGSSGQSYQFTGGGSTVSPIQMSEEIFQKEEQLLNQNQETELFKIHPEEQAVFKKELVKAGDVEFFQNDIQTKLSVALQARDQVGFEFYMDPSGDIVFKPPFYNLNVIPNKPVSWINDFEIIDDSITDTEQEVYTHITSSGNAFGGVMDWGLNDEITTPRTGVFDFHLLRRYGFRRLDYSTEWAGDPRKLFFHLMDYLDRINAKRQNGTITIPLRPELRLGFPIWVPFYDSFFYISGISHQFAVGGQATTTLTLIARRQKFIAPNNIGIIKKTGVKSVSIKNFNTSSPKKTVQGTENTYSVSFPDQTGASAGLADTSGNTITQGQPVSIRDPKTGKLLGFPNVVMVFRSQINGDNLQKIIQSFGSKEYHNQNQQHKAGQNQTTGTKFSYNTIQLDILRHLQDDQKGQLLQRLRAHRYEAGMTNAGAYDYAHDSTSSFKEISVIPASSITWGAGTQDPNSPTPIIQVLGGISPQDFNQKKQTAASIANQKAAATAAVTAAQKTLNAANTKLVALQKQLNAAAAGNAATNTGSTSNVSGAGTAAAGSNSAANSVADAIAAQQTTVSQAAAALDAAQSKLASINNGFGNVTALPSLNIIVRPVSDEFGFETIGHYRYGRGAYIDRGGIQIASGPNATTPGDILNKINIQFAATGGIISDATPVQPGSGEVINFAQQFEQMQPEDFITGASFRGTQGPGSTVDQIQFTSSTTYNTNMQQNVGRGVWIEADQIRSSKTLAELSPSVDIQGLGNATFDCACALDRAEWLSILPTSLIQAVLNGGSQVAPVGVAFSNQDLNSVLGDGAGDGFNITSVSIPGAGLEPVTNENIETSTGAILGASSPADFFSQLDLYLSQQFTVQYKENSRRELADTGQSLGVVSQLFDADTQTNVLGNPSDNPLLGPASLGSTSALSALQKEVNFNFGLTTQAVANAKTAFQNGSEQIQRSLTQIGPGGPLVSTTTGPVVVQRTPDIPIPPPVSSVEIEQTTPQVQPITVQPTPNIRNLLLNPSQNSILQAQQNAVIPGSGSPGQVNVPPPTSVGQR